MDNQTLLGRLAGIHNAIRKTHPTEDDILIVADTIRAIRSLIQDVSDDAKNEASDSVGTSR